MTFYKLADVWRESTLVLLSSPSKPGKPRGIQWRESEREGEREREDQSEQQRNALHHSELLLSALPLACCGMRNYSTIKVPVTVSVCLVTTLSHVNNAAWMEQSISHK